MAIRRRSLQTEATRRLPTRATTESGRGSSFALDDGPLTVGGDDAKYPTVGGDGLRGRAPDEGVRAGAGDGDVVRARVAAVVADDVFGAVHNRHLAVDASELRQRQ